MGVRPFWVMLDVFNVGIRFFFGTRHKKSIEKIIGEKAPEDVVGFSNGNIVWICDNATEVALVHEIYHSTSWVLEHFGIKDEETGAYIIAYLYRKSIERFRKWQKEHLQKK